MKILIGITGGIAAYKIADLVSELSKQNHEVKCLLTENAKRFVSPLVLETLSGNKVADSLWNDGTEHIRLARWPEVFLIAPASANSIAKFSLGLSDDLLSTVFLATDLGKVRTLLAPAMNTVMFQQAVVQKHLQELTERGVRIIPPASGVLACKEEGEGKLPALSVLLDEIFSNPSPTSENLAAPADHGTLGVQNLAGKTILITGGPTISRIDAVRYITNPSTGKMALAMANAAAELGATVKLVMGKDKGVVTGPVAYPKQISIESVETAREMLNAALQFLPKADGVIACAAVMDYEVVSPSQSKIKRLQENVSLELKPAPDVLVELKKNARPETWFLGFAAETDDIEKNAKEKMVKKQIDFLFANRIAKTGEIKETGFGSSQNAGILFSKNKADAVLTIQSKDRLALEILKQVSQQLT